MWAMGILTDEALEGGYFGPTLGMECAGEVIAVGPGVTTYRPGDAVVCLAPGAFASHVRVSAAAVLPKPDGLSFTQAATIPIAFFTAYYALKSLARLRADETVLIHGAAGGVGLAAIQYAHHVGARVIGTAGTEEKRAFLRGLGVEHVFDSRSLHFADNVMHATNGEGVNVVLNSLSGAAMERSLELLSPGGRFLELGKRDFHLNTRVGLRPLRRNVCYFGIDADELMHAEPELARKTLDKIIALFKRGVFRGLPYRVFPSDEVSEAFRLMQQSGHIGKIVVDMSTPPREILNVPSAPEPLQLPSDGVYLVVGGLRGFGFETARWLAAKGARHIVLASRTGVPDDATRSVITTLSDQGVDIETRACDVARSEAVAQLVADITVERPLRGIVHAAMVLDDALVANLTERRVKSVLLPKIQGAWNLHRHTVDQPLEFFILYSSATTLFGNPGQAAYVAANTYLEQFATYRRQKGLPALAVCWGPIGDAGYLARDTGTRELLAMRTGSQMLSSEEALNCLEQLLRDPSPVVAVAHVDWRVIQRTMPASRSPKFSLLLDEAGDAENDAVGSHNLIEMLRGKSADEAAAALRAIVVDEVTSICGLHASSVDTQRPLGEFGVDSLLAVELQMALERRCGIALPVVDATAEANIETIVNLIGGRVLPEQFGVQGRSGGLVARLAQRHGVDVTDAEVKALTSGLEDGLATKR